MLPGMDRLLDCDRGLPFHDEKIKVFSHQNVNGFGQAPHDAGLDLAHGVDHGQRAVLENRIAIKNKESCVHEQ